MKTASVAMAKNQLSRLLQRVKRGETILITDRSHPVPHLVPVRETSDVLARLITEGALLPPEGPPLNLKAFRKAPRPKLSGRTSLLKAILAERDESR